MYTFSFYCPPGQYSSGSGQSDIFYPTQNGDVKLWVTYWNSGGSYAENRVTLLKNGSPAIPAFFGGKCAVSSRIPVVTTDQLRLHSRISCNAGPAGTATVKTTCLDWNMLPGDCDMQHKPK